MNIELDNIASGYSLGKVNTNFTRIAEALNDRVLWRQNIAGQPNAMQQDLDMNSFAVYNTGAIRTNTLFINGVEVEPMEVAVATAAAFVAFEFTASNGQTNFSVSPFTPSSTNVEVVLNGLQLLPSEISTASTNVTIPACSTNDSVLIKVFTKEPISIPTAAQMAYTAPYTGAVTRVLGTKLAEEFISVRDFMAVVDNSADNYAGFAAAFSAALAAGQKKIYIPEGQYTSSEKIVVDGSIEIWSDCSASIRFTSNDPARCGILFDYENGADTLVTKVLPQLFGPAIPSSFVIPNYSAGASWNYNLASRIGSAVHIKGGNRIKIYTHYMKGWQDGYLLESTTAATCDNYDLEVGVMDFVEKGLHVYTGPLGSFGMAQVIFKANTIWAKFPLYFNTANGYILSSKFDIGGVYVNENGGSVVYSVGTALSASSIRVNWADAGRRSDSVPATPVGLVCPFIAGDQASNGISFDGMGVSSNLGYFGGQHCDIQIGAAFNNPTADLGSASVVPKAGDTIRIRDAGRANVIKVLYANYESSLINAPISTTTLVGEANYNGGVGGAQYAKNVYCSATLTALAAGSSQWHYIYHQLAGPSGFKPFLIAHKNEVTIDNNIIIEAFQTGTTNREVKIRIKNAGSAPFTGIIYFWVVVG